MTESTQASIPAFASAAERDAVTTWEPGRIAYAADDGLAFYNGSGWEPMGAAGAVLAYATVDADVVVPAGPEQLVLSTVAAIGPGHTTGRIDILFPSLDFTSVAGGEAIVYLDVGTPAVRYPFGRVRGDRSIAWPVWLSRRVTFSQVGAIPVNLVVDALSGGVTLHAGTDQGEIALRVVAL
jgi:hypothetical protein